MLRSFMILLYLLVSLDLNIVFNFRGLQVKVCGKIK